MPGPGQSPVFVVKQGSGASIRTAGSITWRSWSRRGSGSRRPLTFGTSTSTTRHTSWAARPRMPGGWQGSGRRSHRGELPGIGQRRVSRTSTGSWSAAVTLHADARRPRTGACAGTTSSAARTGGERRRESLRRLANVPDGIRTRVTGLKGPVPSRRKGCRTSLKGGVLPNLSCCRTLARFAIEEGTYEHDAQRLLGATLGRQEDRLVSWCLDKVVLRAGLTRRDPVHPPRGLKPRIRSEKSKRARRSAALGCERDDM